MKIVKVAIGLALVGVLIVPGSSAAQETTVPFETFGPTPKEFPQLPTPKLGKSIGDGPAWTWIKDGLLFRLEMKLFRFDRLAETQMGGERAFKGGDGAAMVARSYTGHNIGDECLCMAPPEGGPITHGKLIARRHNLIVKMMMIHTRITPDGQVVNLTISNAEGDLAERVVASFLAKYDKYLTAHPDANGG